MAEDYEDFEEPEDIELEMEMGKKDEDIYDDKGREGLLEDDEIEAWEEGFMAGAEGEGQDAKCKNCDKVLMGPSEIVEQKIKGHIIRFCSELCVGEFEDKLDEADLL